MFPCSINPEISLGKLPGSCSIRLIQDDSIKPEEIQIESNSISVEVARDTQQKVSGFNIFTKDNKDDFDTAVVNIIYNPSVKPKLNFSDFSKIATVHTSTRSSWDKNSSARIQKSSWGNTAKTIRDISDLTICNVGQIRNLTIINTCGSNICLDTTETSSKSSQLDVHYQCKKNAEAGAVLLHSSNPQSRAINLQFTETNNSFVFSNSDRFSVNENTKEDMGNFSYTKINTKHVSNKPKSGKIYKIFEEFFDILKPVLSTLNDADVKRVLEYTSLLLMHYVRSQQGNHHDKINSQMQESIKNLIILNAIKQTFTMLKAKKFISAEIANEFSATALKRAIKPKISYTKSIKLPTPQNESAIKQSIPIPTQLWQLARIIR